MYKVGMKLYEPVLKGTEENLLKVAMEYLCMMFEPEKVVCRIKDLHHEYGFKKIDHWMLFENCGVYMITIDKCYHEYYLVDKIYDHSKEKLEGMLKAKLVCTKDSEMARIVNLTSLPKSQVRGRLLGTEELHKYSTSKVNAARRTWLLLLVSTSVINTASCRLMLLNKFSTASSKLVLLEEINTTEHG
ncbi:hypothetical protein L6452_07170 [Arctium lappa]|uniref:Uncharacterized protein n=1 Tax=Arctium lappa TaxID=4217 RepID=A0ACB9ELF0_ARCLA|nr:hypothetical protein L6452_07170 [Arctium lappa]